MAKQNVYSRIPQPIGHGTHRQSPAPQFVPHSPVQPVLQAKTGTQVGFTKQPVPPYAIDFADPLASLYGHSKVIAQPIQPKLMVGAVGDQYEQEADTVAAQVVQKINSPDINNRIGTNNRASFDGSEVQREAIPEEEEIQAKFLTSHPTGFISRQELTVQRKITDPELEQEVLEQHKSCLKERSRLHTLINTPRNDVGATETYRIYKERINEELDKQYRASIAIEHTYLYGFKEYKTTDAKKIKNDLAWIVDDLKEIFDDIQKFWRDVSRAANIRTRLRDGAAKYRANSRANIPELYAGTVDDAKEVNEGKTPFATLINDSSWFQDTEGAAFIRHAKSRSAAIGYSPAGESYIPLHIGHRNKKD